MTKRFGWVVAGVLLASLALGQPAMAQKVRLATTAGDIVLELDAEKAPKTVDNFLQYVKAAITTARSSTA
jgi:peptidyl-prolyl cis-trans isomerase A (cyclophilin A)